MKIGTVHRTAPVRNYNEWIFSEKINVNQKKYILANEVIPDKKEKILICPLIEC